jgi:hypothetical protein
MFRSVVPEERKVSNDTSEIETADPVKFKMLDCSTDLRGTVEKAKHQ